MQRTSLGGIACTHDMGTVGILGLCLLVAACSASTEVEIVSPIQPLDRFATVRIVISSRAVGEERERQIFNGLVESIGHSRRFQELLGPTATASADLRVEVEVLGFAGPSSNIEEARCHLAIRLVDERASEGLGRFEVIAGSGTGDHRTARAIAQCAEAVTAQLLHAH